MATTEGIRNFMGALTVAGLMAPKKGAPPMGQHREIQMVIAFWSDVFAGVDDGVLARATRAFIVSPDAGWYPAPFKVLKYVTSEKIGISKSVLPMELAFNEVFRIGISVGGDSEWHEAGRVVQADDIFWARIAKRLGEPSLELSYAVKAIGGRRGIATAHSRAAIFFPFRDAWNTVAKMIDEGNETGMRQIARSAGAVHDRLLAAQPGRRQIE